MATVSFNKLNPQMKPAKTEPVQESLYKMEVAAPRPAAGLPTKFSGQQLEGEFSSRDMRIPRLQLGAKSGKLTDEHPEWIGHFIYDGAHNLGKSVTMVVVKIRKYYEENLEFGSDEIPRRFDKKEQADAEGCAVRDVADVDMLVEVPDSDPVSDQGLIHLDKKAYLPARYTVRSTAYGNLVGILLKDWAGWLAQDLSSGIYTMSSEKRANSMNSWFVPALKTGGKIPAKLRAEITDKFGV